MRDGALERAIMDSVNAHITEKTSASGRERRSENILSREGGGGVGPTSDENTKDHPLRNWECDVRGTGWERTSETSHQRGDRKGHGRLNGQAAATEKDDTDKEGGH
jgi:hypothetical protein